VLNLHWHQSKWTMILLCLHEGGNHDLSWIWGPKTIMLQFYMCDIQFDQFVNSLHPLPYISNCNCLPATNIIGNQNPSPTYKAPHIHIVWTKWLIKFLPRALRKGIQIRYTSNSCTYVITPFDIDTTQHTPKNSLVKYKFLHMVIF
jgi:hypothetical protein